MDENKAIPFPTDSLDSFWSGALPFTEHPAVVYLASLSEGSRRTVYQALNTIAALLSDGQLNAFQLNWAALRYQHTAAVRAQLAARYKPATANKMLSVLRQVLLHAWKLGQMSADDYQRARAIENVKGDSLPAGRNLGAGELSALIGVCEMDPTAAGARDAAIIAVMYATGVRRASVVYLDLADYDGATGTLRVRHAKRRKEYLVYLSQDGAQRALADWLVVRGESPGPLFWPVAKGGEMANRRLSTQAVYNLLIKRARQAGIDRFSPHDLRRTLAGDLLDAGADIVTVKRILGHASVDTTARYDRRPEEVKRKAANLIHVPYRGRRQQRLEDG
ncbi:MAG: tyrosine-type recombinase/integrase [Anaerolineae bacterium]|nr:tyrosine-type recombinase/integrase [Anaerolineae bacterium]